MNIKLENYLCNRYPRFFDKAGLSFDCADGWFFILNWMFSRVEKVLEYENKNKPPEEHQPFVVLQIKEKFGTLRVYHTGANNEEIWGIVRAAESLSSLVCEETGVFNETVGCNSKGWIKTLAKDQAGFNSGWSSVYDDNLLAILEEIKIQK